MRQAAALVLVGLCAVVFPLDRVLACGDKLLLTGRDFPYVRPYAAVNPASILIYLPKSERSHSAGSSLASVLRRAGHDAEVIGSVPRLTQSLRAGTVDVVLASLVDMPDAETASAACPSRPVFLPVVYDASTATLAAATHSYGFALKTPDTASHFLGMIDQAMDKRPSHVTRKH
jgi:hypothetical protein